MANKGSSFERTIAKKLSLWFSKGRRNDIFWRSTTSGARATMRMKKGIHTADSAGDLMAIHTSGKIFTRRYILEIKRGYNRKKSGSSNSLSVLSLLDAPNRKTQPLLFKWWNKIESEKLRHKRGHSLIIFRRDRHNACICMSLDSFKDIKKRNRISFASCKWWLDVKKDHCHLRIFLLNDFLQRWNAASLTKIRR